MSKTFGPFVAGTFYPADPVELQSMLKNFFAGAKGLERKIPKAIIAPHAGYIYSGPIAASAYACLNKALDKITNVVVIAPSHRYPFYGLAVTSADFFATPLGVVQVNKNAIDNLSSLPQITILDAAFSQEHSLEVQLPFLQMQLRDFALVPILTGDASAEDVAEVLEKVWGGSETLIVISSDLSHYHDYAAAKKIDGKTAEKILALDYKSLSGAEACGYISLRGLLKIAGQKNLYSEMIDLRNSGDTQGGKDQVVGYGAFHFREKNDL